MDDQRDDYRELDARPTWLSGAWRRRKFVIAAIVVVVVVAALVVFFPVKSDRNSIQWQTILVAESNARTCHSQWKRTGQFPASLADLRPGFEVDHDRQFDGWCKPFRYAVVPNEAGELEPYVWTERTDDKGRTTIIGAKVRSDGKVVRFGLPDD